MTPQETSKLMTAMRVYWPSFVQSEQPAAIRLWAAELADVDFGAAFKAVREISREGSMFAPPVGAVVKAVADAEGGYPLEMEAWEEVTRLTSAGKLSRGAGPLDPADFTHPIVYAAAAKTRGKIQTEAAEWAERAFRKTYRRMVDEDRRGEHAAPPLPSPTVPALAEFVDPVDPLTAIRETRAKLAAATGFEESLPVGKRAASAPAPAPAPAVSPHNDHLGMTPIGDILPRPTQENTNP